MPPTSASHTRAQMALQFASVTGVTERQATKHLKAAGFKLNDAIDTFFDTANSNKEMPAIHSKLDGLFESLRDANNDDKNKLELDSTMDYLSKKLKVNLENVELFVALELIQAPSLGEITRRGYVEGWKAAGVRPSHQEHAAHIRHLVSELKSDAALFKKVYRYAFVAGRERDQKALALENALIYWGILFTTPRMSWRTENYDWLDLWKTFLKDKWTRSVNRDMWNMTLEFALKTLTDETLSFWSQDGAWPGVIDEFVEWCQQRGIGQPDSMDVDAELEA
ncbi:hypothetical protein CDD81_3799 [Ophiocordyceps australis]|uniref:Defective in cullin neddylation protein n=1 Tax=Ophiocordyceps australis TaxID=1399860 RepID=A0A2C5XWL7_9HYPO|nr:hypothetical protein CDD81_3799 [Ophiocordyceps australis]